MSGNLSDGIDDLGIVARRLETQGLAGERFEAPEDVVSALLAVQAQEFAMAKWAVGMRTGSCDDDALEEAFDAGRILRTHLLRPTWHFVAPEDIRWLLTVTAPGVRRAIAYQDRVVGIDEQTIAAAEEGITDALGDESPLTRKELGERLAAVGIAEPKGNRLAHFAMHAEIDGLICSGPRRGKQHTYVLLDERVPDRGRELTGEGALAALAERFMRSHGPATVHDLAKWASLRVGEAREAVALAAPALERFSHDEREWWHGAPGGREGDPPPALLLPEYDEAAAGYRDLRLVFGASVPGDAVFERPVLVDGSCVGTWSRTLGRESVDVAVHAFRRLGRAERAAVESEANRFASFTGLQVGSISWVAS